MKLNKGMKINGNIVSKFLVIVLSVGLLVSSAALMGAAQGQDSVPDTARHIKTAAELAAIGGVQSAREYYVLDNDINLVDEWVPIEDFMGTFDGQGYSVNNLYVLESSNRQYAGLFGQVDSYATVAIKNVGVNINSKGVTAVGSGPEYSYISACAGGLLGKGIAVVSNCYATGDVAAISDYTAYAGGLIGWSVSSLGISRNIQNCYAAGDVTASGSTAYAGGLIGYSSSAVTYCYAVGDVASSGSYAAYAGGLIGNVHRNTNYPVTYCYASGDVTASSDSADGSVSAGGLIGDYIGTAANCYALGDAAVSSFGSGYVGGLVGNGVAATNCYATGDVTASSLGSKTVYAGCLFGTENLAYITRCYYLSSQKVVGDTTNSLGEPLTSAEMKTQQSFVTWDFDTVWAINAKVNNGYPTLRGLAVNNPSSSGGSSSGGSSGGTSGGGSSGGSSEGSSPDGSSLFDNPLVLAGIALIAIAAVAAVVVVIKKRAR
ncbi:MAG: hypothetical protein LBI79_03945 [Nitrososphaerota archaeon]|nr:hypothetical protein [Nitrososphaerota archaeon]